MPLAVVSDTGAVIYTREDIELGRQVWQSIGGQQLGCVGHEESVERRMPRDVSPLVLPVTIGDSSVSRYQEEIR